MTILSLLLTNEDISNSPDIFHCYSNIIPSYRHDRIISSKNEHARAITIYAGLLMADMIQTDTGINMSDIIIGLNENGKPFFHNLPDYYFSISHSENLIVMTSDRLPVGIDAEHIRSYNRKLASRYFHHNEYEYLESLDANKQNNEFTRLWTMKEAYLKMTGTGLAASLDSFCVIDDTCGASFENHIIEDYVVTTCSTSLITTTDIMNISTSTLLNNIKHSK